jgi:hypothetical protein
MGGAGTMWKRNHLRRTACPPVHHAGRAKEHGQPIIHFTIIYYSHFIRRLQGFSCI